MTSTDNSVSVEKEKKKPRIVFETNLSTTPEFDCIVCHDLEFHSAPTGKPLCETNVHAVKSSATDLGCLSCCVLRDGLQHYAGEWQGVADEYVNVSIDGDRARNELPIYDTILVTVTWTPADEVQERLLNLELYRTAAQSNSLQAFEKYSHEIAEDPDSDSCFSVIKEWIVKCDEHHRTCFKAFGKLPTRVVKLSLHDDEQSQFLYESHGETAKYLALSHCWGPNLQILKTTKATTGLHKESICWSSLSNTFRDAITICRKLKVEYIWIDSLCIVQDDLDDWQAEAAKMRDVYNGAYLVISATAGIDGSFGCLFARPPSNEIKVEDTTREPISARIRRTTAWNHKVFADEGAQPPEQTFPALHRGWTIQERLLANRVLHFTTLEMIWDCREILSCEFKGLENLATLGALSSTNLFTVHAWTKRLAKAVDHQQKYDVWKALLNSYSRQKFTFDSDRLPALGGLARTLKSLNLGSYAAGLWSEHLFTGLVWYCSRLLSSKSGRGPRPYQAPSWSWASIRGPVGHYDFVEPLTVKATLLDVSIDPLGDDPYGKIKSGRVLLLGQSVNALLSHRSLDQDSAEHQGVRWLRAPQHPLVNGASEWTGFYPDDLVSATPKPDEDISVACLLVGTWTSTSKTHPNHSIDYVLVLRESTHTPGTYERIGLTNGWARWTEHSLKKQFILT